ncbi:MAG TPA: DNA alkylation repair protein [Paludibacter sp.]|nr:DNA alkylation repair protein [Paludibacter sp.]
MKYCLITPVLEAEIAEIRRKIMLSMNGITSEKMTQSGVVYKKNYGVDIPRIKEIASLYTPNSDLADRLWMLGIRETMIMGTLLQPIEKCTSEIANEWIDSIHQIELVEQICMNLLSKLSFANELCLQWVSSSLWKQITGFILAARIYDKLTTDEARILIQKAIQLSTTPEFHLYKALSLCLCRLARKDKEIATYISKEIETISNTNFIGQQYISSEVKQELLFLNIL